MLIIMQINSPVNFGPVGKIHSKQKVNLSLRASEAWRDEVVYSEKAKLFHTHCNIQCGKSLNDIKCLEAGNRRCRLYQPGNSG